MTSFRRRYLFPCLLLISCVPPAQAFSIERSQSRYADKHYQYELVVTLDAPIDRVETVLRDYESYPALDNRILQARVIERPTEHVAVLETTVRACFGPFCRNVKRVERVDESTHGLTAITDPARSDVKFGETRMQLAAADDGRTRVTYRTSILPGFWIPSLVGRRWMLNTLEDATNDLFMNVEMKAKGSIPEAPTAVLPSALPQRSGEGREEAGATGPG